jgi:hypothetical protein
MKEEALFLWREQPIVNPRNNSQHPVFTLTNVPCAMVFMHRHYRRADLQNHNSWRVIHPDGDPMRDLRIFVASQLVQNALVVYGQHLNLLSSVELKVRYRNREGDHDHDHDNASNAGWHSLVSGPGGSGRFEFEALGTKVQAPPPIAQHGGGQAMHDWLAHLPRRAPPVPADQPT